MRLLNVHDLSFRTFHSKDTPRYVTASHRWREGTEASIKDVQKQRGRDKLGYKKVEGFAQYVREHIHHVDWLWIDTCCINQESDREVSEAINSMFKWYRDAEVCLAYLSDVNTPSDMIAFSHSEWFGRGWTLQELLAPHTVIFLAQNWEVVGHKGGSGCGPSGVQVRFGPPIEAVIAQITGIPTYVLADYNKSKGLTVNQRLHWTKGRETLCEEDLSYCLLGLFDINMPVIYGEGGAKARHRLLQEVEKNATHDVEQEVALEDVQTPERVEGDSSVIAVATLAAQTCDGFAELRKVCQTLPGRLHALNNEVTDLAVVLDEVGTLAVVPQHLRRTGSEQASVPLILGELTTKLTHIKSMVATLTLACSRSQIPLLQARGWSKVQSRLRTLQDDIRTQKTQLNVIVSGSDVQDPLRFRLKAHAISMDVTIGEHLERVSLDGSGKDTSSSNADVNLMMSNAFQQADERIVRLERVTRAQEARFYPDRGRQLATSSDGDTAEDRSRTSSLSKQDEKHALTSRTDAVGFRTRRYTATCRPGCPCACHQHKRSSTPAAADCILGQLFVGYSGIPLLVPKCSDRRCHKLRATQIDFEYWFPLGYFWSMICRVHFSYQSSLGPHLQMSTLRRVPDDAQSVEYALAGNIPGLKHLFKQGLASPRDVSATRGYSLLRWAMYSNQYETAKFLFFEGADTEYGPAGTSHDLRYNTPKARSSTLLLEEGSSSHDDVLRLLSQGADWVDEQEFTLLHKAVVGLSSCSLKDAISQHPYDLDTADAAGRTPLSWAAVRGDARAIGILLAHGADPNIFEIHGQAALYNSVDRKGSALCCRLLLEGGADPNPRRPKGTKCTSPLANATLYHNNPLIAKTLLDFGADVNGCGPDGKTPLIITARNDNVGMAQLLLEYSANINATSTSNDTPLTTAIKHNSHKVLKLLLDRWFEYSECPRLKGPHLLAVVANYADVETMSILIATDHLRLMYDETYTKREYARQLLQRFDASEELTMLFDDLLAIIEMVPNEACSPKGRISKNKGSMAHPDADVEKALIVESSSEDGEFEDALEQIGVGLGYAHS